MKNSWAELPELRRHLAELESSDCDSGCRDLKSDLESYLETASLHRTAHDSQAANFDIGGCMAW